MKRKFVSVLAGAALALTGVVGIGGTAQASAHIVWVTNSAGSQCHVVGLKEGRRNTVYSAGTSGACNYGRARSAYYSGGVLKYVTGSYGVARSVAEVGPAYGVASYQAAGGGFISHGSWKTY